MKRMSKELEKMAYKLYLEGATKLRIHRELGIPLPTLKRAIEHGDPRYGKRPWRDRRADVYRRREEVEDGAISKTIIGRTEMMSEIERRSLRKLQRRIRKPGKSLTVAELTALSRETTQALRLAADATRVTGPQTQINVSANATAGAMAAARESAGNLEEVGPSGRLTVATIRALQSVTPEEQAALRKWQRNFTLQLEREGIPALPARQDELDTVIDAVVADEKESESDKRVQSARAHKRRAPKSPGTEPDLEEAPGGEVADEGAAGEGVGRSRSRHRGGELREARSRVPAGQRPRK